MGQQVVLIAMNAGSGFMSTLLRNPGPVYSVRYNKVPLEKVANSERKFPAAWITPNRVYGTGDFLRYARLQKIFAQQQLVEYIPQAYR